ncbi:helix-turn-helix domain-containing protein, partial [Micromonospora echinofusca]
PPLLGPLLTGLRQARGWSQLRLAAELCAASGVPTVTRHEVSRWERQRRAPGDFWLGWLAAVLGVPVARLADARAGTRPGPAVPPPQDSRPDGPPPDGCRDGSPPDSRRDGPPPGGRPGAARRPPAPPHRPLPIGYAARATARRRGRPGPRPRRLRRPLRWS